MSMSTLALGLPWSGDIDRKVLPPPPVVCRRGHLPCSVPESRTTSHVVAMSHTSTRKTRLLSGPFTVPVTRNGRTSGLLPERVAHVLRNSFSGTRHHKASTSVQPANMSTTRQRPRCARMENMSQMFFFICPSNLDLNTVASPWEVSRLLMSMRHRVDLSYARGETKHDVSTYDRMLFHQGDLLTRSSPFTFEVNLKAILVPVQDYPSAGTASYLSLQYIYLSSVLVPRPVSCYHRHHHSSSPTLGSVVHSRGHFSSAETRRSTSSTTSRRPLFCILISSSTDTMFSILPSVLVGILAAHQLDPWPTTVSGHMKKVGRGCWNRQSLVDASIRSRASTTLSLSSRYAALLRRLDTSTMCIQMPLHDVWVLRLVRRQCACAILDSVFLIVVSNCFLANSRSLKFSWIFRLQYKFLSSLPWPAKDLLEHA